MKITIVNDKDEVVGHKERGTLDYSKDIYRVSALWITNSKGEVLLAKRSPTKKQHPNKWGPAVAGTIEEGETYDSNMIKEAEEELGLKNIKPEKWIKTDTIGKPFLSKYQHFTQWYKLKLDKPSKEFKVQEEEVAEIGWFTKEELTKMKREEEDPILTSVKRVIEHEGAFS